MYFNLHWASCVYLCLGTCVCVCVCVYVCACVCVRAFQIPKVNMQHTIQLPCLLHQWQLS